jgi:hypothetical protein
MEYAGSGAEEEGRILIMQEKSEGGEIGRR